MADPTVLRHLPSYLRFVAVAACGLALDLWSKHWAFHTLGQGHEPRVIIPHVLEFRTMLNSGALFGIGGGQTVLFLIASACALLLVFWMFSQTSRRRWALQIALGAILAGALGNMYDRVVVRLIDHAFPHGNYALYTVRVGEDEQGLILKEYPPHEGGAEYRMRAAPNPEDGVIVREYPRGVAFRYGGVPQEAGFVRDFLKIPTTLPQWSWIPAKVRGKELWPWVFNVADMLLVGGVAILAVHLWRDRKRRPKPERIAVDARRPAT
jgi:lipoprotein signal peptidase